MPCSDRGPQSHRTRLRAARRFLDQADVEEARADAEVLYAAALGHPLGEILADQAPPPTPSQEQRFQSWLQRRANGEPSAYIEGFRGFYGLEFQVDPRVLIPRADSECLVDAALEALPSDRPTRVIDAGTGSGCLLLAVLHHRPLATGLGLDLSAEALHLARSNAQRLALQHRCAFLQAHWLTPLSHQSADLILCNPPYVEPSEKLGPGVAESEPHLALFTPPAQPLDAYHQVLATAPKILRPNGHLLFEVGAGRATQVAQLGPTYGLTLLGIRADLAGIDRVVCFMRR